MLQIRGSRYKLLFDFFNDLVLIWIFVLGLVAFVLMGYDKLAAKISKKRRVREKNFWLVAALGGFGGVVLGAIVFHHKVAKGSFWPPIVVSVLVWLTLLYLLNIL
ncbi:MAG: DUF1294 domain-containing protein [Nitrososphaerales archaeon]